MSTHPNPPWPGNGQASYEQILDEFTRLFGSPNGGEGERMRRLLERMRVFAKTGKAVE